MDEELMGSLAQSGGNLFSFCSGVGNGPFEVGTFLTAVAKKEKRNALLRGPSTGDVTRPAQRRTRVSRWCKVQDKERIHSFIHISLSQHNTHTQTHTYTPHTQGKHSTVPRKWHVMFWRIVCVSSVCVPRRILKAKINALC